MEAKNTKALYKPGAVLLIGIVTFVVLMMMIIPAITPARLDISVGDLSPTDIVAARQVADLEATQSLRAQAMNSVGPIYRRDDAITLKVTSDVDSYFAELLQARKVARDFSASKMQPDQTDDDGITLDEDDLEAIRLGLSIAFEDSEIYTLAGVVENDLLRARTLTNNKLSDALGTGIREDDTIAAIGSLKATLIAEGVSAPVAGLAEKGLRAYLRANFLYDEEGTQQERQNAANRQQTITYQKGDLVVAKGEEISEGKYAVLRELGIAGGEPTNIGMYAGIGLFVAFSLVLLAAYIFYFEPPATGKASNFLIISIVICLTTALCMAAGRLEARMAPVYLAPMLITLLISPRAGFAVNICSALIIGAMQLEGAAVPVYSILTMIIGGMAGVYALTKIHSRSSLIKAGFVVSTAASIVELAFGLIHRTDALGILINTGWAFGNGLLCAVLCIGTLPVWEWMFDVVTPTKLLELSNSNQPLLKRLMMEAPGTYHHSVIVANLAEAAASAANANALLARTGAFYHDAGKLKRPYMFKENQSGENPHDKLIPSESAQIISAHARDGAQLAQKYKLPRCICDIIAQHHGTSLIQYFYARATREGMTADEADYRYLGPKPRSKEAAIIMLADIVEAAVRSCNGIDNDGIVELIDKLVSQKLMDGQLDECELTLKDIENIKAAFARAFHSMRHERVDYKLAEEAAG
ncbi:MAG: HD family phosphohydrolase [Christensenellales bacterium]